MKRAQLGEHDAFAELVRIYHQRTYRCMARIVSYTLPRAEVDDLCQEVFLKIHRKLNTFDPELPGTLSGWILKIASRTALDALRRHARTQTHTQRLLAIETDVVPLHPSWRSRPDDDLDRRESRQQIMRGIAGLSPSLRAALVLRHFHHFELEEIAAVIGLPAEVLPKDNLLKRITRTFRANTHQLRAPEDLSLEDLATLLDISKQGVLKRLQRARLQLEAEIRELAQP